MALYIITAVFPSEGGMWRIAAIPQLLALIPVIYLLAGVICLARAAQPMTFRDWYASWRRIRTSSAWSLGFTAAMVLAELLWLFTAEEIRWGQELGYLVCTIGCAALSCFLYRYITSHPCRQVTEYPEQKR